MEGLVNHPVHISEKEKVSALIPFCYLGDEFSPTEEGNFQDSVCKLFREKIVSGQVCYEVDVSHHRERSANWGDVLQRGFSFIIDTNDEYDVKNLLEKKPSGRRGDVRYHSHSLYERKEKDNTLSIFLKTISKRLLRTSWRGPLRTERRQDSRGDGGVCRTGGEGDSLSDRGVQGGLSVQQVQGEGSLSVPVLPLELEDPLRI